MLSIPLFPARAARYRQAAGIAIRVLRQEEDMGLVSLAKAGNYMHIYDFRVKPGTGEQFIKLFDEFDYSDANPMHKSKAQVKDGVLCRDVNDPDHFYLLGEWADIEVHAKIRKILAEDLKPEFVKLIEGKGFIPTYAEVVSSTPQALLDKASA
jgi:quinol monooxygenase YgiN